MVRVDLFYSFMRHLVEDAFSDKDAFRVHHLVIFFRAPCYVFQHLIGPSGSRSKFSMTKPALASHLYEDRKLINSISGRKSFKTRARLSHLAPAVPRGLRIKHATTRYCYLRRKGANDETLVGECDDRRFQS